jgi:hypothetical protein
MDFFDERVLAALKESKPRSFTARAATAKKQKRTARLKIAPKSENKINNHFTPISGQASARLILLPNICPARE